MFRAPRYLEWARKHYGKVPYDLASSGLAAAGDEVLGDRPGPEVADPHARLRAAIAEFNGVPEAETIAALGTTHALWLTYASLLRPGDEVVVESPGYEPVSSLAEGTGARVVPFDRGARRGYRVDVDAVMAAVTPRTRVVALTTPHNPTGLRVESEVLRRLGEALGARGVYLLVDEVYAPLDDMTPGSRVWGKSARRLGGHVVAVSSLTKWFGLGDARVGWVLASKEVIARAEAVVLATLGHLPARWASHGAFCLSRVDALDARARALTHGKREVVEAWLRTRPDLAWSRPGASLFGFAVREASADLLPVIEAGAEREGVLVAAGTFFGVPNGFRLSWTIDRDRLPDALARLGRILPVTQP